MKRNDALVRQEFFKNLDAFNQQLIVCRNLRKKIEDVQALDLASKKIEKWKEQLKVESHKLSIVREAYETGPKPQARKRND